MQTNITDKIHNHISSYHDIINKEIILDDEQIIITLWKNLEFKNLYTTILFIITFIVSVRGTIEITSKTKKNLLKLTVRDTSIEISKEDLPHVFDRFYKADKSRTKKTGGTGLGLSIAKLIINKHFLFINRKAML